MTQIVFWIVGIVVFILIALFGFFAGVAASTNHAAGQQAGFSIHL
jgi:hypothetical protein